MILSRLFPGHGILEFSTEKAGQDVTPINLDFGEEKKRSSTLNSITGKNMVTNFVKKPLTKNDQNSQTTDTVFLDSLDVLPLPLFARYFGTTPY